MWMCACKPMVATAFELARAESGLQWSDRVAEVLPSYAQKGKARVTFADVATHAVPYRPADPAESHEAVMSWACALGDAQEAELSPEVPVGSGFAYAGRTNWIVLAGAIEAIQGDRLPDCVRRRILRPVGAHRSWLGDVPRHKRRSTRLNFVPLVAGDADSPTQPPPGNGECIARVWPGTGGFGPVRELGFLYEALAGHRRSVPGLSDESVAFLTTPQRNFDTPRGDNLRSYGLRVDLFGSEFAESGLRLRPSVNTFGHKGLRATVGFADPALDLVVAIAVAEVSAEASRLRRSIVEAIYRHLQSAY